MGGRARFVFCDPMCDRNRLGPNWRSSNKSIYEFLERLKCGKIAIELGKHCKWRHTMLYEARNASDRKVLVWRSAPIGQVQSKNLDLARDRIGPTRASMSSLDPRWAKSVSIRRPTEASNSWGGQPTSWYRLGPQPNSEIGDLGVFFWDSSSELAASCVCVKIGLLKLLLSGNMILTMKFDVLTASVSDQL